MADFIEEETILMNDPLFSREALADYRTKLEHPVRQNRMKNYTIKAEDENKMWEGHQRITVLNARYAMDGMT